MPPSPAVCPTCGHAADSAEVGKRCPTDGVALVSEAEHQASPEDPFLGRVIAGKYPVIGRIGTGTMGSVYRALQEPVGREVAIKVIKTARDGEPDSTQDEGTRERFVREAKIVAGLSHPATVTLHDYGVEPDGTLYMVLELVKGKTLSAVLRRERWMAPGRAVAILYQVLQSLAEAHAQGLVHRDLKPANVMVVRGPFGEELVKVLDFGVARSESRELSGRHQTQAGTLIGTPRYMSPEQARGQTAVVQSDLYAAGVILYELLCGSPPFGAKDPMEALLSHLQDPVPPLPPEFATPPLLEAAVRKALEKEPADRFPNAMAMAKALMEARTEVAGQAPNMRPAPSSPAPEPGHEIANKATMILAPTNSARVGDPAPESAAPVPVQEPKPAPITPAEPVAPAAPIPLSTEAPKPDPAPAPVPIPLTVQPPAPSRQVTPPRPIPLVAPQEVAEEEGAFEPPPAARSPLPILLGGMVCALVLVAGGWFAFVRQPPKASAPVDMVIPDPQPDPPAEDKRVVIPPPPDFDAPDPVAKPRDPVASDPPKADPASMPDRPKPPLLNPKPVAKPPTEGQLAVECSSTCRVYVDGTLRGSSPQKGLALPPGRHLLWVKDTESGKSQQREVTIQAGATLRESFEF